MPMTTLIQPGAPVAPVNISTRGVTIGDVEIDFAVEQRDDAAAIVVRHHDGRFVRDGEEGAIVAIVRIPARRYTEQPGEPDSVTGAPAIERVAEPLDVNAVTLELWPFVG